MKILVVNDMAAMEDLGYAQDIVAVNEMIGTEKQVIVITEQVRSNSLVMDQMMTNFKFYAFVLTQYATAILKEYALKASMWTILLLIGAVVYLSTQINKQKQESQQNTNNTAPKKWNTFFLIPYLSHQKYLGERSIFLLPIHSVNIDLIDILSGNAYTINQKILWRGGVGILETIGYILPRD